MAVPGSLRQIRRRTQRRKGLLGITLDGGPLGGGSGILVGSISLRTLILIRWIAIFGQASTVLLVHYGLGYTLPLIPTAAVIAVSVLLNIGAMVQGRVRLRLVERDAAMYMAYDMVQLAVLLYLTGGLQNPFAVLLLAPLTVSAIVLSRRGTTVMTVLLLALLAVLAVWHYPLPGLADIGVAGPGFGAITQSAVYRAGVWFALSLSAIFIAAYVWQVADEARMIDEALTASQMALAREQRISALGALSAAAAHELGTPLGTILMVARELADDLPADTPIAEDVELLLDQAQRCRDILADLTRRPETTGGDPYEVLTLPALIDVAARPHLRSEIDLEVSIVPRDASRQPTVKRSPALLHGLGNLLQNACQFARHRVAVRAEWSRGDVSISILDDGPGFPAGLIPRLGEPYVRVSDDDDAGEGRREPGMGLGIFIAATLLGQTGAKLRFGNAGGAQVVIRWKRNIFEAGRM